ncbi:hypothetical protein FRC03_012284 [Tulasnella sp. 419]|nr:hypothetical protein FRC03_012284 [Tulasnella sp. 419]
MNGTLFRLSSSLTYRCRPTISVITNRVAIRGNEYPWSHRNYVVSQPSHRTNVSKGGDPDKAEEEERKRENLGTSHSKFISEAKQSDSWEDYEGSSSKQQKGGISESELKDLEAGRGKLSPTSTHLFKLMLPLPSLSNPKSRQKTMEGRNEERSSPPTVFLLHPSQPLSHVSRLIQASLPATQTSLKLPTVTFESEESEDAGGKRVQWSDSTDVGDFVKEAARSSELLVVLTPDEKGIGLAPQNNTEGELKSTSPSQMASQTTTKSPDNDAKSNTDPFEPVIIPVAVPSFEERTRFLRRRLEAVRRELRGMQDLKDLCDREARKGAKRLAVGGFAILVTYWIAVFRLTFFTELGWDFMEPVTYLTEFLFIMGGYIWFLRQGREVSYSSILNRSVSTRQQNLYAARGLDIERWVELVTDEKALKKEIERIREDYDAGWKESRKDRVETGESALEDKPNKQTSKEEVDGSILDKTLAKSTSKPSGKDVDESEVVEKRREQIRREEDTV